MGNRYVVKARRPAGGEVEPVAAVRVSQGDDVPSGVVAGAIAGDVTIGNREAVQNFEEHILLFVIIRKRCKECDGGSERFAHVKGFGGGILWVKGDS